MAGAVQRDRAQRNASSGPSGCAVASGTGQFGAVQIVAPSLGVELSPIDVRDASEIERGIAAFASGLNGGLVVTGSALGIVHRKLITTLAARHKLPAVYSGRYYVTVGGLISYGPISSTNTDARPTTSTASSRAEAGRLGGAGADQVRTGHQSQNRQGARPCDAPCSAWPRRRDH